MLKPLTLSLSIAALFAPSVSIARVAAHQPLGQLQFTITEREQDGLAQLSLSAAERGRFQMSGPHAWTDFDGFHAADLRRDQPASISFARSHAAGALNCRGVAGAGAASGTCHFDGDEHFAAELTRRGFERPGEHELFIIALSDFEIATLDALAGLGHSSLDLDNVVAIAIHDLDAAYANDLARAGYRLDDIEELIAFRIHDVTPAYIASLPTLGPSFTNLSAEEVLALRIHDVTPEFVAEMRSVGFTNADANDYVAMRIHDVTPAFVSEMRELGFDAAGEDYVAMRVHEVTPAFVQSMAQAGYRDLELDTLVAFRIHEVTPEFIRRLSLAGYSNLPPDQLVSLRVAGVTPDYARDMEGDGLRRPRR